MKRLTIIFAFTAHLCGLLQAQGPGGIISLFVRTAVGAPAAGRGATGMADAGDAFASYWNPAALAFMDGIEVVYYSTPQVGEPIYDPHMYNVGYRYNLGDVGTIGGHIFKWDLGTQYWTDEMGVSIASFSSSMTAYVASFGIKLSPQSSIGINTKIVKATNLTELIPNPEGVSDNTTESLFDFSYYRQQFIIPQLDFGVSLGNIIFRSQSGEPSPNDLKVGAKWRAMDAPDHKLALFYDMRKSLIGQHPSIDFDGDGYIGGYNENGDIVPDGDYGRNGSWEAAHVDTWARSLITAWYDDWLYGGNVDLNGNGIIDDEEIGNQDDGSLQNELDDITHYIGVEYLYLAHYVIRAGIINSIYDQPNIKTYGLGVRFAGFTIALSYSSSERVDNRHISLAYAF